MNIVINKRFEYRDLPDMIEIRSQINKIAAQDHAQREVDETLAAERSSSVLAATQGPFSIFPLQA